MVTAMEPVSRQTEAVPVPRPAGSPTTGLLLSRDLIFTSKIKGTAADLGYLIMVAGSDAQATALIEAHRPRLILIDLTAGPLVAPTALVAYQALAGPATWFVAFGPHVDGEALAGAKSSGCHTVMPRSRFAAELPELLRRYFSESGAQI